MDRPARYLTNDDLAALQAADDLEPEDQLVADAADDVSAGRAPGEVATLDPLAGPVVEDEILNFSNGSEILNLDRITGSTGCCSG